MMLVPTRLAPSSIHGLGVFAGVFIPLGASVWRFEPGFDQTFTPLQLKALPSQARAHVCWFSFLRPSDGRAVLSGDHARFMNHSDRPNTGTPPADPSADTTVALRDIAPGEEITCDYFAFDADAARKLSGAPRPRSRRRRT